MAMNMGAKIYRLENGVKVDVESFNEKPCWREQGKDTRRIGTTKNARIEGDYVVVDIELEPNQVHK